MSITFFIPGNTPSSKNGKQWTGKYLVHSKQSQVYYKSSHDYWQDLKDSFVKELQKYNKPYKVEFTFVRKSKHKFDYVNPLQTVLDLMVKYHWIDDDNADEIKPYFGDYIYDKVNPGVIIKIIK